ncbi:hypothetical protein VHEMI08640 [[Torrubiella] hemipterigena]|uniref:tRNA dimethylallyltransferase n=1 Tax=[Torrubiella] hemipterigena TaxID=1531966 RepID=A0A0A1TNJ8_9HYPO|nr:hypothetical protein VHEMI08640 [[Torrubiella] hemipterigena]
MQLYNGLPIITNKIPLEEQKGIPHHLLGEIPLSSIPWHVAEFKQRATTLIDEIRGRGKLPILVGGTHYYVDSILFNDAILDHVQDTESQEFPILDEPTDVLLAELRKVDPEMAERWHPNDRRKIRRSLEIYLQTGKPASSHYEEQELQRSKPAEDPASPSQPWENLLFWVFTQREALCERLDKRIDGMLQNGLLDEVRELAEHKQRMTAGGVDVDLTKGIWQAIGYKQLVPHVLSPPKDSQAREASEKAALDDMKTATRRYANYQNRWIRLKQLPRLQRCGETAINSLYVLDSTDVKLYNKRVIEPATSIVGQFLAGTPLPSAKDLSEVARDVLLKVGEPVVKETAKQRTCDLCKTVLVTEEAWERHIKSSGHRKQLKKSKRLALVPVESANDSVQQSDSAEVDIGDLFGQP